jgi:CRP/FNR family cyclic AMP-dependent transcriptional regulator
VNTTRKSSLALRRVPLLAGLPEARLDLLAQQCQWRSLPAGKRVFSRRATEGDVVFIVSGRVRVTTYAFNGREVTFRDVGEGDYVGDVAAIDGQPRSADVLCLEPSVLATLDRAAFRQLLAGEPAVAERVMVRLAALVRHLSERVIELSTLGVQNRLHAQLLRMAREAGVEGNRARLAPAPQHLELAARISTNREQVTRELSSMVKQGLIAKDGKALLIRDVARLEAMVAEVRGGGAPGARP